MRRKYKTLSEPFVVICVLVLGFGIGFWLSVSDRLFIWAFNLLK